MNFELQTSQKLAKVLTTEQLQHLEILQLSNDELENLIYERATENPLINTIDPQVTNLLDYTTTVFKNSVAHPKMDREKHDMIQQIASKESSLAFIFDQISSSGRLIPSLVVIISSAPKRITSTTGFSKTFIDRVPPYIINLG